MDFHISLIAFNICLIFLNKFFAKLFKLYDHPNNERKLHKKSTPLTGGLIIILNLIFYCFFLESFNFDINIFLKKFNYYIFLTTCIVLYLFGVLDDKFSISPNTKFILLIIIILPIIILDSNISLSIIRLSFLGQDYYIGNFTIVWTVLCFLLLFNAINMFDGINLQVGFYILFVFIFFISNDFNKAFFISLSAGVISFLILNFRSNSFLGDGGAYLISFLLGYFFIKMYNLKIILHADQVVLFMLIPGLDLMRLFIIRILNKKHPFSADRNHLHHLLLKKFSFYKVILIIQSLIFLPVIFNLIFGYTFIYLVFTLMVYSIIIYKTT